MTHLLLIPFGAALVALTLPITVELAVLTSAYFLPRRGPHQAQLAGVGRRGAQQAEPGGVGHAPCSSPAPRDFRLAVIVPAHNEELLVARAVAGLRAEAAGRGTRIVVIAHNCSDRTAAMAAEAGAEVLVYNDPQATGKGFALRYGFASVFAQGADGALVIDADSTVSGNLIDAVRGALAGGADAVQCRYEMNPAGDRLRGRLTALALRGFNFVRPAGRERLGLSSAILGNGFAVRKQVFQQIPYRALSVVEDLEYHIHLVMAGKRVEFLEDATVSAELPATAAGEATQRSRWEGGRFGAARQWMGTLAKEALRGRPRLLEPLLDLAGLPIAYDAFLLLIGLAAPWGWLRIYCATGLAILALHVLAAAWAGGNFWRELRLLCLAPAYILWKLRMVPRLIRGSAANAQWIRTERAAPGSGIGDQGSVFPNETLLCHPDTLSSRPE